MSDYAKENRIGEALRMRGLKQVELVEKTGLNKSAINNWINQRWQPKQKSLMIMARALDVSEMWLAGYDVPMERPAAQKKSDELSQLIFEIKENEDLQELFSSIISLTPSQYNAVKNIVKSYKEINTLH